MTVRIVPVPIVSWPNPATDWMYEGIARVGSASSMALYGHDDLVSTGQETFLYLFHVRSFEHIVAVAVEGEDRAENVIGFAQSMILVNSNPTMAELWVTVHPDHRSRGVGTQLADWVETQVAARGRTSLITYPDTTEPVGDEPVLTAAEGDTVPANTPGVLFALARGYTLRQVARRSRLDLPVSKDLLAELYAQTIGHHDAYRFHQWLGAPPDPWLEKLVGLNTAMSTDTPMGELSIGEDPYDVERLQAIYELHEARDWACLTTAAEHIATGEIAGFTDLIVPRDTRTAGEQWNTIVARDHRGHRLGLAIKVMNLRRLADLHPQISRLYTWNASENAHMLAINTALGFYPSGGCATLQKGD
ncbi:MAG: GNAT family N-acetyltransferase [Propionibacteriaceae bacterium]|jgi:GNAT superfamily N-acetyltransferase|nr:GNAT family N-acetyltransferase [Propionibacteriaceae bacterium]